MGASEWGSLLIALAGFFALGHLINYLGESVYWRWRDWRESKEDEKMLEEQEDMLNNVVRLDDVRKSTVIIVKYEDDTIH
jgi:hypothetical protein